MTYTLNDNDLGEIINEEHNQSSDLERIAYPLSGSSEVTVIDYNGVKRVITIRGRYSADTSADLWNWIATINALQDGNQITVIFHSDGWDNSTSGDYTDGNFDVKVASFRFMYINEVVLSVEYTLTLFEGESGV